MSWLLTSCATPPASVPTAWSFWAWRELLLGLHPVGDVGVRADPLAHLAVLVEHRDGADLHVAVLAVAPPQPVLRDQRLPLAHRLAPDARRLGLVLGLDRADPAAAGRLEGSVWPVNATHWLMSRGRGRRPRWSRRCAPSPPTSAR